MQLKIKQCYTNTDVTMLQHKLVLEETQDDHQDAADSSAKTAY